jgi:hypothetical protein
MSDRFAGFITIGGSLRHTDLDRFVTMCHDEGLGFDGVPESRDEIEQRVRTVNMRRRPLAMMDDQARYGQFNDLEALCTKLGLTWCRRSEGKYEYDAEYVWWQPGMAAPRDCYSTQNGEVLVTAEKLVEILRDAVPAADKVNILITYLKANTPPEIPPLVIVD